MRLKRSRSLDDRTVKPEEMKAETGRVRVKLRAVRVLEDSDPEREADETTLRRLPRVLKVLKEADRDLQRVLDKYPADCYQLFLTPSSLTLKERETGIVEELLKIEPGSTSLVQFDDKRYRLWLSREFCG